MQVILKASFKKCNLECFTHSSETSININVHKDICTLLHVLMHFLSREDLYLLDSQLIQALKTEQKPFLDISTTLSYSINNLKTSSKE